MPEFLTRLVQRTLGLTETIQPVISPMFSNEAAMEEHSSTAYPTEEQDANPTEEQDANPGEIKNIVQLPETGAISNTNLLIADPVLADQRVGENTYYIDAIDGNVNVIARNKAGDKNSKTGLTINNEIEADRQSGTTDSVSGQGIKQELFEKPELFADSENPANHTIPKTIEPSKELNGPVKYNQNTHNHDSINMISTLQVKEQSGRTAKKPEDSRLFSKKIEQPFFTSAPFLNKINNTNRIKAVNNREQPEPGMQGSNFFEQKISSTPPTIKVTIGSIDVRAVMEKATPTARPSSPSKPKLSLNDYLEQRDGGRG